MKRGHFGFATLFLPTPLLINSNRKIQKNFYIYIVLKDCQTLTILIVNSAPDISNAFEYVSEIMRIHYWLLGQKT
ncbi:hypothetical protein BLOT_013000, partial [Blomia tropicalis]